MVECYQVYGKSAIRFPSFEMYFCRVVDELILSVRLRTFLWRVFISSYFHKTLQYSQENTYGRVSFK